MTILMTNGISIREFDPSNYHSIGLFVAAGGFEDRALAFARTIKRSKVMVTESLLLKYESQREDNNKNFNKLNSLLEEIVGKEPTIIPVNANLPLESSMRLITQFREIRSRLSSAPVLIDISAMTHLWAVSSIHGAVSSGMQTIVGYTEAKQYFPSMHDRPKLLSAWKNENYDLGLKLLQSAGLKAIHLHPDFAGNFRPGKQTCLLVFVGYEPNRIQGLVDDYAPGSLVVIYGHSPHRSFKWRTDLSRALHHKLFSQWHCRETETSTFDISQILEVLEREFQTISEKFDIAIAPQCSKMQAVASYIFWRRHPEAQLLFTSPVRFNPSRYSRGAKKLFVCEVK